MRRRRIVLYNPRAVFYTMPLALVAVGSHLDPERYEVIIIDGRLEHDPEAAVIAALDGALCLGVTVLTGQPIVDALAISRAAKRARPDITVVWGGWHPSMFATECLADRAVDATVQAQGEATFADLVDRLDTGRSLDGCEGCTYRAADGTIVRNPARPLASLDTFRPFDYTLLSVDRYYTLKGRRQLDYISSQGCHFRCGFCADPFVYQRKWVGLPPSRVGDELAHLWRRYGFVDVNFQDETFFTRPERVDAIAQSLIAHRLPISWAATMRADQGTRLPDDLLARCKRSGLRRVLVGVESGHPATLQRIKKDITIEQVFITAEKLRRFSIAGQFPFIVGFPREPVESIQASLDVALRLRAMSPDFRTPFFYFRPYPGATLTEEAVRDGYRLPSSLDEWAAFDFVGSAASPWVSADMSRRIERFKFYQELAYDRAPRWRRPLQYAARWRCRRHDYRWPVEMRVGQFVNPPEALS
jgi:anaerobic magnesium-protoporphyrin IX monomethyl ester cyclase